MLKKYLLGLLGLVALITASCGNDPEEYVIQLKTSGVVSLVLKAGSAPVSEATATIYIGNGVELIKEVSNSQGVINFGELNSGTYFATVEAKYENKTFLFQKAFQVITGSSVALETNILEYTGTITTRFIDSNTGAIADAGLSAAIFSYSDLEDPDFDFSTEALETMAFAYGVSDAEGEILFEEVPTGDLYVIYYSGETIIDANRIFLDKDEEAQIYFEVDALRNLIMSHDNWNVTSAVNTGGTSVNLPYSSLSFDFENGNCTAQLKAGGSVTGDFYYYSSSREFYFSWGSPWNDSWYSDITASNSTTYTISYYDYSVSQTVRVTFTGN